MEHSLLATLVLGFGLGLQHSLDADHLMAVSTLVGRDHSRRRSAMVGALWGLGHTLALVAAAAVLIAFRVPLAPAVATGFEVAVGFVLCVLGADLLVRATQGRFRVHSHPHAHADQAHRHLHVHVPPVAMHAHEHPAGMARPFVVGVVHGLAGSAALALAVLGTLDSAWTALAYVLVFGGGTILGMLAMSALLGVPIAAARRGSAGLGRPLEMALGAGAIAVGLSHAWHALLLG